MYTCVLFFFVILACFVLWIQLLRTKLYVLVMSTRCHPPIFSSSISAGLGTHSSNVHNRTDLKNKVHICLRSTWLVVSWKYNWWLISHPVNCFVNSPQKWRVTVIQLYIIYPWCIFFLLIQIVRNSDWKVDFT